MPKRKIKIATFNVNSVRTRLPIILDWLDKHSPDVLCLQETKVQDKDFPLDDFMKVGYMVGFHGQKSYNGVAIATKKPPMDAGAGLGDKMEPDQARLIWVKVCGINVINTYVPQGREVGTDYYKYKLQWLTRLNQFIDKKFTPRQRVCWVGDLNIAPEDIDLHNPKGNQGHPCFNPEVTKALNNISDWGFVDVFRKHHPEEGQYSWFDYRTRGAVDRNIGWRVDHIFATKVLANKSVDCFIDTAPRKMEKPSDHCPVVAVFEI